MIKDQIASIPRFPSTSRNSWPIGKGKSLPRSEETEVIANEDAINNIQPKLAVAPTPINIAIGAARAAPATSSAI